MLLYYKEQWSWKWAGYSTEGIIIIFQSVVDYEQIYSSLGENYEKNFNYFMRTCYKNFVTDTGKSIMSFHPSLTNKFLE